MPEDKDPKVGSAVEEAAKIDAAYDRDFPFGAGALVDGVKRPGLTGHDLLSRAEVASSRTTLEVVDTTSLTDTPDTRLHFVDTRGIRPPQKLEAHSGEAFGCTKTYNHSVGLSCVFRQWRAKNSHCRFLHGYAIRVQLDFESEVLDDRNWVEDFGDFGKVKAWLEATFDHKTVVAADDPQISIFKELDVAGMIQLVIMPHVGMEAFAKAIYDFVRSRYMDKLVRVTVSEHEGNSAWYGEKQ